MANAALTMMGMVAGGIGAEALDRKYPEKAKDIGGVTITAGAQASGLAFVGLALFGRKLPDKFRRGVTALAGGAFTVEAVKVGSDFLNDMKAKNAAAALPAGPGAAAAPGTPAAMMAAGYRTGAMGPSQWELQQRLMAYRGAY